MTDYDSIWRTQDEILREMSSNTFSDEEQAEFWDDFDNLQKAKIIGAKGSKFAFYL